MKKVNKIRKQQDILKTDNKWHDLILNGQLTDEMIENSKKLINQKTVACIQWLQQYIDLGLFSVIPQEYNQKFKQWDYILAINSSQYLLLKINSIRDKYKVAYFLTKNKIKI